jgi:hypothetical protein
VTGDFDGSEDTRHPWLAHDARSGTPDNEQLALFQPPTPSLDIPS